MACNTEMFYSIIMKTSIQMYKYIIDLYTKNILTQLLFQQHFSLLSQLTSDRKHNPSVHSHFSCFYNEDFVKVSEQAESLSL